MDFGGDSFGWTLIGIAALLGVTFGLWKIIELVCWFFSHVQWA